MVGFTLVSRSYYYLRRRSPAPPFPPDHRQVGGTGGYNLKTKNCPLRLAPHCAPPPTCTTMVERLRGLPQLTTLV
jgi:hypothetical protein